MISFFLATPASCNARCASRSACVFCDNSLERQRISRWSLTSRATSPIRHCISAPNACAVHETFSRDDHDRRRGNRANNRGAHMEERWSIGIIDGDEFRSLLPLFDPDIDRSTGRGRIGSYSAYGHRWTNSVYFS
jgi:hypothetical protein